MKRALPLLLLGLLGACAKAPVKPAPAAPELQRAESTTPAQRRARPDKPGEYTAGGLYRPGVPDSGPAVPPDISALVEPVPRPEPRARYGNRSPYTVLGRSYHVMDSSHGYVERGTASWYGEKFHGRATSSLEPYDMLEFSAAHKTLPLPTYVRVTNLENGRSVVVRVNDRGPFHAGRIIDLSYAAAIKLGMHVKGTARVEVRALEGGAALPATQSASAPPASGPSPRTSRGRQEGARATWLQVASFGDRGNARRFADRLEQADLDRVKIQRGDVNGDRVYRVRLGPFDALDVAHRIAEQIRTLGFGQPTLVAE